MLGKLNTIRTHIILTYVAIVTVAISILGVYSLGHIESYGRSELELKLRQSAGFGAELVTVSNKDLINTLDVQRIVNTISVIADERVTLISLDGTVQADSSVTNIATMDNHGNRPEFLDALSKGWGKSERYSTTLESDMLYIAKLLKIDGVPVGVLRVAMSLHDVQLRIGQLRRTVLLSILGAIVLTGAVSIIVARRISRPIEAVGDAAETISGGQLGKTITLRSSREMNKLVESFNRMSLELKENVDSIRENEKRISAIVTNMVSGLLYVDGDNTVLLANPAAKRMLHVDCPEGKHYVSVVRNSGLIQLIERCMSSGTRAKKEIKISGRNDMLYVEAIVSPLTEGTACDSRGSGVVILLHDVTEARELERSRRDLIANVSHELRTPVTAIKGFAETLLQGALNDSEDRVEFVTIIDREADRLRRIIEDLLQLARLEAGQLPIEVKPTDVNEIVDSVIRSARTRCSKKSITLDNHVPQLPKIMIDAIRFEQIIANLFGNAIKYTPAGGHIELLGDEQGDYVVISVKDNGIGIAQEHLTRVFERFYRVDSGRSRESGGTGLGLAIVKHLVSAQDGFITVESEVNIGTKVSIHIPKAD